MVNNLLKIWEMINFILRKARVKTKSICFSFFSKRHDSKIATTKLVVVVDLDRVDAVIGGKAHINL